MTPRINLPDELGGGAARRDGRVRNGRMRRLDLEAEVLSDEAGTLLTDEESGRVGVGAEVILESAYSANMEVQSHKVLTGQIERSTHLRFCVPKTLRRPSTTPPCSRGFMAHVPRLCQVVST